MSVIDLGIWGRLQVVIEDTDVTFFRDVPVIVDSWSSGDPFDDASAVLRFPQISPFEVLRAADLFWVREHALVDINLVRPDNSVVSLWEGMVASVNVDQTEESSTLSMECIGALYQLDYYIRPPLHYPSTIDPEDLPLYEEAIANEFHPPSDREQLRIGALNIQYPVGITETGWKTRYAGSWEPVLTGYIQRLLADMVHGPGDTPREGHWTLMKDPDRKPVLKLRNQEADYHITCGTPGVTLDLKADFSQITNVIFGEGSDESDTTWRNADVIFDEEGDPTTVYYPLGWDESVHAARKDLSERGELTDPPPDIFSPNYVRIETQQQYGSGVSLADAVRSANQQVRKELLPGYFGTISLRVDPEEISKFEIKAGKTIRLRKFQLYGPTQQESWDALLALGHVLDVDRHGAILRVEFAESLVSLLESMGYEFSAGTTDAFSDTSNVSVNKLADAGIAHGFPDGTFRPNEELTRGQMVGFLVRAAEWADDVTLTFQHDYFYDDDGSVHEDDINKATENYLIFGNPNRTFGPENPATWTHVATVLQRLNRWLGGDIAEDKEGRLFHIAQAQINFNNASVDLTVDTEFRDLATIDQLVERNKQANKSPAKMLMANRRSAITEDEKFPWDYEAGSGSLPQKARTPRAGPLPVRDSEGSIILPAERPEFWVEVNNGWTIVPIVMSGKGSVQRSEVRAFDASGQPLAIPFHVGIYGLEVTTLSLPPDAFAEGAFDQPAESGDALSGYDPTAIILWGQFEQRAGYWPSLESEGASPTGVLIDEGTWQFQLDERHLNPNTMWVAIYAEAHAFFQGRFFHGVQ